MGDAVINVSKVDFYSEKDLDFLGSLKFQPEGLVIRYGATGQELILTPSSSGATGPAGAMGPTGPAGDPVTITGGAGIGVTGTASNVTLSLLNTSVVPGSYTSTNLTVDAQGRITSASNGSGGGGGGTIYSGMLNVNSGSGAQIVGNTGTNPTSILKDISNVNNLLDLSSYFNSNTNVITINTSISISCSGSLTNTTLYVYTMCYDSIDGTGTSLPATPEMTVLRFNGGPTSTILTVPINIILKNNTDFDSTCKYLQIFLYFISGNVGLTITLRNQTIPAAILSL